MNALKVGDKVRVPWGLGDSVEGEVLEVWGDSAAHIRVALRLERDEPPVILLLTRAAVEAA